MTGCAPRGCVEVVHDPSVSCKIIEREGRWVIAGDGGPFHLYTAQRAIEEAHTPESEAPAHVAPPSKVRQGPRHAAPPKRWWKRGEAQPSPSPSRPGYPPTACLDLSAETIPMRAVS